MIRCYELTMGKWDLPLNETHPCGVETGGVPFLWVLRPWLGSVVSVSITSVSITHQSQWGLVVSKTAIAARLAPRPLARRPSARQQQSTPTDCPRVAALTSLNQQVWEPVSLPSGLLACMPNACASSLSSLSPRRLTRRLLALLPHDRNVTLPIATGARASLRPLPFSTWGKKRGIVID